MFDRELIKKVIYEKVPNELIDSIIVFGSCARNEEKEGSDTDILVTIKCEADYETVLKYQNLIRRRFVFDYGMSVDILVRPSSRFNGYKNVPGSFEYNVNSEGIFI